MILSAESAQPRIGGPDEIIGANHRQVTGCFSQSEPVS